MAPNWPRVTVNPSVSLRPSMLPVLSVKARYGSWLLMVKPFDLVDRTEMVLLIVSSQRIWNGVRAGAAGDAPAAPAASTAAAKRWA